MMKSWSVAVGVGVVGGIVGCGILFFRKSKKHVAPEKLSDLKKRRLLRERYNKEKVKDKDEEGYDYVVIGAGMSGLSCATVLSRLGNRCNLH